MLFNFIQLVKKKFQDRDLSHYHVSYTKETIHIISCQPVSERRTAKFDSLTQFDLSLNGCNWHILEGNDERIDCKTKTENKYYYY